MMMAVPWPYKVDNLTRIFAFSPLPALCYLWTISKASLAIKCQFTTPTFKNLSSNFLMYCHNYSEENLKLLESSTNWQ